MAVPTLEILADIFPRNKPDIRIDALKFGKIRQSDESKIGSHKKRRLGIQLIIYKIKPSGCQNNILLAIVTLILTFL
jgi:hypothetical protein